MSCKLYYAVPLIQYPPFEGYHVTDKREASGNFNKAQRSVVSEKGKPVFQKCVREKPTAGELQKRGPFRYQRNGCLADFFVEKFPLNRGAWVCRCAPSPSDTIVTGLAVFPLQPEDVSGLESSIIDTCSVSLGKDMQRVCRDSPSDIELLGLHLLSVFCKRAHTRWVSNQVRMCE